MALRRWIVAAVLALVGLQCCMAIGAMAPMNLKRSSASTRGSMAFASPSGRRQITRRTMCAAAIPGNSLGEDIVVGGLQNFCQIFNNLLIGRVLLTWFPAAQGVAILQPLFQVCDPYLNAFRGIIPAIGGIDFSPLLAFTFLQVAGGSMASLGAEPSSHVRKPCMRKPPAPWSLERAADRYLALKNQ